MVLYSKKSEMLKKYKRKINKIKKYKNKRKYNQRKGKCKIVEGR